MKTLQLIFITALATVLVTSCEKDSSKKESQAVYLLNTIAGGCNNYETLMNAKITGNDTVYFMFNPDSLVLHAGLNYACCAPFVTNLKNRNDSIIVTISDVCTDIENCYCRCMCYYTWDFVLTNYQRMLYKYKIIVEGKFEESYILHQGSFDASTIPNARQNLQELVR